MNSILIGLGVLVALALVRPLVRTLLAGAIGAQALARQPDRITLARAEARPWARPEPAADAAQTFGLAGFEDGGTWTVPEMPGLVLKLMANAADGFYAVIYEHPKAGSWLDVVTSYTDGTSATFSSNPPTGLSPRPGHRTENLPGASASQLLEHAKRQRPRRPAAPHTIARAPGDFTRAYAESIAWRKQKGVSAREVAEVAKTRRAA